jgi:peptidoglycan/LPS O-acetylase OafA/YrhL
VYTVTYTTLLLSAFSPVLVALIRQTNWKPEYVRLLSLVVILLIFIAGKILDGYILTFPPSQEFVEELGAAWAVQQIAYGIWEAVAPDTLRKVETAKVL